MEMEACHATFQPSGRPCARRPARRRRALIRDMSTLHHLTPPLTAHRQAEKDRPTSRAAHQSGAYHASTV